MKPSILLCALVLASVQWATWAQQPATAPARNAQSQERPLAALVLDDRAASEWGLQPQEWARYRELMDGPLGIYSPNLDPLSALGIEADELRQTLDQGLCGDLQSRQSAAIHRPWHGGQTSGRRCHQGRGQPVLERRQDQ